MDELWITLYDGPYDKHKILTTLPPDERIEMDGEQYKLTTLAFPGEEPQYSYFHEDNE